MVAEGYIFINKAKEESYCSEKTRLAWSGGFHKYPEEGYCEPRSDFPLRRFVQNNKGQGSRHDHERLF